MSLALLLMACTSTTGVIPVEYQFTDLPDEGRISLRFKNELEYPLCLQPESWPNSAGKINQASSYVFLIVDGERFPIDDFNTGYCPEPRDCATRVAPGEEISASISYSDFNIPTRLRAKSKTLEFSPIAVKCR
jgi:hypothetical protein